MAQNELYPIFLKVDQLQLLIVGGGKVALEKLSFLLKSSPHARVQVVALELSTEVLELCRLHQIPHEQAPYHPDMLAGLNLVIAATNDRSVNEQIAHDARARHLLVNVADTPDLCDFYLGGIVTKGPVKIAISTNGYSPTLAKRLRQWLEELLPDDIGELAEALHNYRHSLKGNFQQKIETLNLLTRSLLSDTKNNSLN